MSYANVIAQTSANSSPRNHSNTAATSDTTATTDNADAGADEVIARLIREGKAGRELIAALESEIKRREAELALERETAASTQKSYDIAQREIAALRLAVDSLTKAFAEQQKATTTAIEQRDKERQKRKQADKRALISNIITAAVLALRFL